MNAGIGRSPYMAMFGTEPKLGLSTTTLPSAVSSVLHTEEALETALSLPSTSSAVVCMDCGLQTQDGGDCSCRTAEPRAAAERRQARQHQSVQADRMLKRARSQFTALDVGDNVTVGIPDVDRSRVEHRNLICVVLEVGTFM